MPAQPGFPVDLSVTLAATKIGATIVLLDQANGRDRMQWHGLETCGLTGQSMSYIEGAGHHRQLSEPNESRNMRSQLLTVRQVSEWLNVSPSWVRDHATNGRRPTLPSLNLGKSLRFREDQLAEWIRQLSEQKII